MNIKVLKEKFICCKTENLNSVNLNGKYVFIAKTETENSIFCPENQVTDNIIGIEKTFNCFMIEGTLDFSLVGIIYNITKILAEEKIPVCVISTFDTDYFFIKDTCFEKAKISLQENGYFIKG